MLRRQIESQRRACFHDPRVSAGVLGVPFLTQCQVPQQFQRRNAPMEGSYGVVLISAIGGLPKIITRMQRILGFVPCIASYLSKPVKESRWRRRRRVKDIVGHQSGAVHDGRQCGLDDGSFTSMVSWRILRCPGVGEQEEIGEMGMAGNSKVQTCGRCGKPGFSAHPRSAGGKGIHKWDSGKVPI